MLKKIIHIAVSLLALLPAVSLTGCGDEINNDRIPAMPVDINLSSAGLWATYGIGGIGMYRYFIKGEEPSNFPWLATTYTGFGGVLLVGVDAAAYFQNDAWPYMPKAYDMACPVEADASVRVYVDENSFEAVCPMCKSRYTLYSGGGPVSGEALGLKYGLKQYNCTGTPTTGFRIYR